MVLKKGEREAGTLLVAIQENGANMRVYERMPGLDGTRKWHRAKDQANENAEEISTWLARRGQQDPDLWIVELDIADGERFIGLSDKQG